MKHICMIATVIVFLLLNSLVYSQINMANITIIEPYHLLITFNKTTSLIFPYAIRSVDRGSRDILAQKALGAENILFVKADKENFTETNLSVITADGKFYSFLLDYSSNPPKLNISFTKDTLLHETAPSLLTGTNEATLHLLSEKIAIDKRRIHDFKDSKYKIQFRLSGIYISNDIIYFKIELQNHSNINYEIEMLRFFIRDQIKSKRTASQEIEIQPIYKLGDISIVKEQSKKTLVYALPKFTIPDRKYLSIQLMEKNGSRHLHLNMLNRSLVKAKSIGE